MTNNWRFRLADDGKSTEIHIHVDFAFRSALLQRLLEPFFEEAQKRLIGAFEKRAYQRYGDPSAPSATVNNASSAAVTV
jgi:coenzyme Q-binding protein COQ10